MKTTIASTSVLALSAAIFVHAIILSRAKPPVAVTIIGGDELAHEYTENSAANLGLLEKSGDYGSAASYSTSGFLATDGSAPADRLSSECYPPSEKLDAIDALIRNELPPPHTGPDAGEIFSFSICGAR